MSRSLGGRSKVRQSSWRNGRTHGTLGGRSVVAQPVAIVKRVRGVTG